MALGSIAPVPIQQFLDNNGKPVAGGRLYSYLAGTTTPLPVYADYLTTVPLSNPVVFDSAGRAPAMFLGLDTYKFVLKSAADVTVWTADNIASNVVSTEVDHSTLADRALSADHALDSERIGGELAANVAYLDVQNNFTQTNTFANVAVTGGLFEAGRPSPAGHWTDIPYNAALFTANGGTWTVTAAQMKTFAYMMIGRTMWLEVVVQGSTISGGGIVELLVQIPAGIVIARPTVQPILIDFGVGTPTAEIGYGAANLGNSVVQLQRINAAFWPGPSSNVALYLSIKISF